MRYWISNKTLAVCRAMQTSVFGALYMPLPRRVLASMISKSRNRLCWLMHKTTMWKMVKESRGLGDVYPTKTLDRYWQRRSYLMGLALTAKSIWNLHQFVFSFVLKRPKSLWYLNIKMQLKPLHLRRKLVIVKYLFFTRPSIKNLYAHINKIPAGCWQSDMNKLLDANHNAIAGYIRNTSLA